MRRIICIVLCFLLLPYTVFAEGAHWAQSDIERAVRAGIIEGSADGLEPDRPVTRAELVSMALRTKGEIAQLSDMFFTDVAPDAWYFTDVSHAAYKGYISGAGGGLFLPDEPITRQDAAVVLCRVFGISVSAGLELSSFIDAMDISDYALGSIAALSMRDIINGGADRSLRPLASLTRAEAVVLLLRMGIYNSVQSDVSFARGYPRIANSSLANGFHVAFKTNLPCTIYYAITDAETAGGAVVPNPSELTDMLINIINPNEETICFIPADGQKTYNLFFTAKTLDSASRTAWISRVRPHSYAEGDGSPGNPYRIIDEQQLSDIRYQSDKCYQLENNIVLSSDWEPIGSADAPFTGTFDGGGHAIRSLSVSEKKSDTGLFSYIGEKGTVKNLYVDADKVTGTYNVGILAGQNDGTIENCQTTGIANASGNIAGGLVGSNQGHINNCMSAASEVRAHMYSGGIAGYNSGTIDKCAAYVHTVTADTYACGIAAVNTNGIVKNCLAAELNVLTGIVRNSSRIATNREKGTTENNYGYNRMNAELDDGYQSADAKNGADISWLELSDIELCKKYMGWSGAYWSQSEECAFIAPRLSTLPVPNVLEGSSVYAPKRISSEDGLAEIDNARGKHYMLTNDITLTKPWTPLASEASLLKNNENGFSGTLNGNGHAISGLKTQTSRQRQMYGLFGMISGGSVFSLTVSGNVAADNGYAGLIAAVSYGYIEDCDAHGSVVGSPADEALFAGGAVGANYGYIDNCDVSADIDASGRDVTAGGIAAYQENYINNCLYKGHINISSSSLRAAGAAGGITGYSADGFIYNTCADVSVSLSSNTSYAGGSVGMLDGGELYKASSRGTVNAASANGNIYVGGLCGLANGGLVMNSFSTAGVTADAKTSYAGGLVGYNISTSIQDNYAANTVVQQSDGTGLAGGICAVNENGFISSNVAANPSVNCDGRGARICAQSPGDTISNNYAYEDMSVNNRKVTDASPLSGEPISYQRMTSMSFYLLPLADSGTLGWESGLYGGSAIWDWKPRLNSTYPFPLLCGVKGQEGFRSNRYR